MPRYAFQLQIRAGMEEEYDRIHTQVWPELLEELSSFGVTDYSIFRRDRQLFLYLRVQDFNELTHKLAVSEVNQRWQRMMAPIFEPVSSLRDGEEIATMEEVFFMRGRENA